MDIVGGVQVEINKTTVIFSAGVWLSTNVVAMSTVQQRRYHLFIKSYCGQLIIFKLYRQA